jgi:hypothetical protein
MVISMKICVVMNLSTLVVVYILEHNFNCCKFVMLDKDIR